MVLKSSQSAENNKAAIFQQLEAVLPMRARVLEIASGTGQHAVHFARQAPQWHWQPSDIELEERDLLPRLTAEAPPNVLAPIILDIAHWPNLRPKFDAVFSANCIHIAPASLLPHYVEGCAKSLVKGGIMTLYGPFQYGGKFTSDSNESFDTFLRETTPHGGIREFNALRELAEVNGLEFVSDTSMPSNNQFLIFRKA